MTREPQQQPTPPATPGRPGRTDIRPLCDEASGGGGSSPDTRDRGMPGGSPAGPRQDGCRPIGRPDQ